MKFIVSLFTLSLFSLSLTAHINEPWGIDSDLAYTQHKNTQAQKPKTHAGQKAANALIRFFQVYISPIDGPRSSFYPTSSQYALESIRKHGVLRGISLGCDRLLRENGEQWVYETTTDYGIERKVDPVR